MIDFYDDVIQSLLASGWLNREMKILVVCAAGRDRDVMERAGLRQVVLSNLFSNPDEEIHRPYPWNPQDVENMTFRDDEFDFVIAHDGLHHCQSPHRGLLEMYRVARLGILVFEPRDSLSTRIAGRLNLGQEYEVAAVVGHAYLSGGFRNTVIPNFVYRWTERQVRFAINSNAPWGRHHYRFFHGFSLNWEYHVARLGKVLGGLLRLPRPFIKLGMRAFPRLGNLFAFAVLKPRLPEELHPWVLQQNGSFTLNRPWVEQRFGPGPKVVPAKKATNDLGECAFPRVGQAERTG